MSHVAGDFTGIIRDRMETGTMTDTAPTIADSTATDVAGLVADFNELLAALRDRGVIA